MKTTDYNTSVKMTLQERVEEIINTLKLIDYSISGVIPNHEYEILYNIPELIQELQTKNKELEEEIEKRDDYIGKLRNDFNKLKELNNDK